MSFLNRLFGPPDIEKLGHEENIPGLIRALRNRKYQYIRLEAAKYLGLSGKIMAVEPLIGALIDDPSPDVRKAAAQALGQIRDRRAVTPLLSVLKSQDEAVRPTAARALGKIGDPQAVEPLIAYLQDQDKLVQFAAVEALGQLHDDRAVAPLIDCLNDEHFAIRRSAAESLEQIHNRDAIAPLITRLRDQSKDVRRCVARALEGLGWQPAADETGAWYWIARQEWLRCIALGEPAVKPLTLCLTVQDREVQMNAAGALGKLGEGGRVSVHFAVEPMIGLLKQRDNDVEYIDRLAGWVKDGKSFSEYQWRIQDAGDREKWQTKDAQSFKQMIEVLNQTFGEERIASAWSTGETRDWGSLIKLAKNLQKENQAARRAIIDALGQIGDKRAVAPLADALRDPDPDLAVAAALALGKIGEARPVAALEEALKDLRIGIRQAIYQNWKVPRTQPDPVGAVMGVNQASAEALDAIGWSPENDETGAWYWLAKRDWQRCVALAELAVIPLAAGLGTGQPECVEAARCLGEIKDERAVEPLIWALKQYDVKLIQAAALALGQIRDARALDALAATLENKEKGVRLAAIQALAQFGAAGRPVLISAVGNRYVDVRIAAIQALAQTGDPAAVAPVIAALQDSQGDVRLAAAQALGQIPDERSFEPLISATRKSVVQNLSDKFFSAASMSLAQISGRVATEALIAHLDDPSAAVRVVIAQSLEQNGWQPGEDETGARYWIARQDWPAVIALGPLAVDPLLADLKAYDPNLRKNAARALGSIGDPAAVEPLIAVVKDTASHDKTLRIEAARALGQIGDPRAVEPLIAWLQYGDIDFRTAAVQALDETGWKPDGGETEAWYRIARGDWDGCIALRSAAVAPLIATLQLRNKAWQKGAAETLVGLYRSGGLSEADRLKVLNQRAVISKPHDDQMHYSASDCGYHTDDGIGVEFRV